MVYFCKYLNFEDDIKADGFYEKIKRINIAGYDYIYTDRQELLNDSEKEDFFHTLSEVCSASEVPVIVFFQISHFEDIKKLYYDNVKLIVIGDKTTVDDSVIEEGRKRFGKDFLMDYEDFKNRRFILEYYDGCEENDYSQFGDYYLLEFSSCKYDINSVKHTFLAKGIETKVLAPEIEWGELKKNSDGLVPVIVNDYKSGKVLMLAYMNEEAYYNTFKTGLMNYYSRSRSTQWIKGETSGHFQYVKYMKADCDKDTLLAGVSQVGVACHTGSETCFFNDVLKPNYAEKDPSKILDDLYKVIEDRKVNPKEGSYTNYLFDKGLDKILKKVGEEACEIVIASKNEEPKEIKYEIADFLYHLSVLMVEKGVTWEEVADELAKR